MACHDGKTFAPDVIGGPTATYARSAGSIADGSSGHEAYKGHTLDVSATVPGADTGAGQAGTLTLTCFNCHIQHGVAASYRNLGNGSIAATQPTFAVVAKGSPTDMTKDVTIAVEAAALSGGAYVPQGAGKLRRLLLDGLRLVRGDQRRAPAAPASAARTSTRTSRDGRRSRATRPPA